MRDYACGLVVLSFSMYVCMCRCDFVREFFDIFICCMTYI